MGQIGDDVVDVLDANAQANHFGRDAGFQLLFRRQLAMRGGRGMAGQGFGVAHIDHALEQRERIEALHALLEAALQAEGEQGTGALAEIPVSHGIERAIGKSRVIHPGHAGVIAQKLRDLAGVLHVAFDAKGHGLDALKQQETVEGRERGAGVALRDGAAARDVGGGSIMFGVNHAVIGDFGLAEHVVALGMIAPGKFSAIDNHSAERGAVSAHEFGHGVHDDVSAILEGPQ